MDFCCLKKELLYFGWEGFKFKEFIGMMDVSYGIIYVGVLFVVCFVR